MRQERGSAMVWTAGVAVFLLLPLALLVVDGARILYAHARLQQATDAACQALAEASIEEQAQSFMRTGQVKARITRRSAAAAFAIFNTMLQNDPVLQSSASLRLQNGDRQPHCMARASVKTIFRIGTSQVYAASVPDARSARR